VGERPGNIRGQKKSGDEKNITIGGYTTPLPGYLKLKRVNNNGRRVKRTVEFKKKGDYSGGKNGKRQDFGKRRSQKKGGGRKTGTWRGPRL